MAEIMSVLFFHVMKYDPKRPRDPNADRFVLSKGHAAPILYAAWAEAGFVDPNDLLNLRRIDCDLEGHPTPRLEFVDVATGSLGQGLSCAAGMAYTGKYLDKADYKVFCVLGDGESAEGSVWEAVNFAAIYKLDNLVAIFDVNRLGQSGPTPLEHHLETYQRRLEAFGWHALCVDGHDVEALVKALADSEATRGRPVALVAKTFKGHGLPGIEDLSNWHGKPLGDKAAFALDAISKLISNSGKPTLAVPRPLSRHGVSVDLPVNIALSEAPSYKLGEKVATRFAYGTALLKIGKSCDRIIALDGDVSNSTYSEKFKAAFPERYIECYIAEQNMVGVAIGCGTRQLTIPFCSTFAAFFTRAFDQLRMGAISNANIKCCGSHAGVSIGEDGPSQMGLEDLAMFRSLPDSVVLYPSEAVSCERAVELAARHKGIVFIRTTRPATKVIYQNDEPFQIGKSKVVLEHPDDKCLIVAGGITLFEAISAADTLGKAGIHVCVVDMFSVKPVDEQTIRQHAERVGGRVVTVEDHYPEGGIGDAVTGALCCAAGGLSCCRVRRLAVERVPHSGPASTLLDIYGLSSKHIVNAVFDVVSR